MSIQELKNSFKNGGIPKKDFISAMHDFQQVLFDFSNNLDQTEIEKIEIADGKVIYTSRATSYHTGGSRFVCDVFDKRTAPVEAFNFDYYERSDSEIIYKLINKDSVVFDIGANIGWYSIHIAKMLESGKIYAFEPLPDTYRQLKENTSLNDAGNIELYDIALTDKKQVLTFYYSPANTVSSSSRNIMEIEDAVTIDCQASTIDDFVSENNITKLDFIKCDVEGAELFVYKGGTKTFTELKPIIFTEMLRKWAAKFDYHPNDIVKLFAGLDYKCFVIRSGELSELKEVTDETMETNFVFLHKEKHQQEISRFAK